MSVLLILLLNREIQLAHNLPFLANGPVLNYRSTEGKENSNIVWIERPWVGELQLCIPLNTLTKHLLYGKSVVGTGVTAMDWVQGPDITEL